MNAAALVRKIEDDTHLLIGGLTVELMTNLGTSHYRRLHEQEVFQRVNIVFQHLCEWLISRDEAALKRDAEALGKIRFAEGVPLGQVVLALILNEKHLWNLPAIAGEQVDRDVRGAVTEFFQRHTYYTAKGYEVSLAESNKLARNVAVMQPAAELGAMRPPAKKEPGQADPDMEISRGGQVGEFGG